MFSRFPPDVYAQISGLYTALEQSASSIVTTISTKLLESIPLLLKNLPNWILTAVFAVMSSFFFSLDYLDIMSFLTRQLPKRIRGIVFEAKTHFLGTVTKYLKAYTLLFLLTFVELFIGFWLIGIDYAATAAFLISFVDFLPVLGTGAVLLPWIFLEAAQGHFCLLYTSTQDFLYENNERFYQHLVKLGYTVQGYEAQAGHEWPFWDESVKRALAFFDSSMEGRM